jgi:DNA repair protein RecO (recombination protein O)
MATSKGAKAAPWTAFVLHRYDWSESSLILDLLTREGGRLSVAAKGAKRPTSNFRSVLSPFVPIHVLLSQRREDAGEDDLQTLRQAEWAGATGLLQGPTLFLGFYLNELVMKLLPRGDAQPQLFDAYAGTVRHLASLSGALENTSESAQAALRAFELMLLRDMGLLPDLRVSTTTQAPLDAARHYVLRSDFGLVRAEGAADGVAGVHWLHLQVALSNRDDDALRHACEAAPVPLRTMLRAALSMHLPANGLRTREVAVGLRRLRSSVNDHPVVRG